MYGTNKRDFSSRAGSCKTSPWLDAAKDVKRSPNIWDDKVWGKYQD